MRPVIPCYLKFGDSLVSPIYDCINFMHLSIYLFSSFSFYRTTLYIMPKFVPNAFMLNKFASKLEKNDPKPWEIYAWCVRDAMANSSGMKVSNFWNTENFKYSDYVQEKTNEISIDGKTYKAPNIT